MDLSAPPAVPKLISEGWVHTGIQDSSLCWGYFFSTFSLQRALYEKMCQKKGKNPGRWRGTDCCSRPEEEWWMESGLWGGQQQRAGRYWAAPLISHIINSRQAPSSCAPAPTPLSLGFGSSCRKKLSDSDGLIILLKIQQQQNEQGWVDVLCHHSVLGRERGQAAPRLPILPGASAGSEHIVRAQDNLLEKKQFQVNGQSVLLCQVV